jgi:hypothetical protein
MEAPSALPALPAAVKFLLALALLLLSAARCGLLRLAPAGAPAAAARLALHPAAAPAAAVGPCAPHGLEVSGLFGSGMVLQHGEEARVWGWAPRGCAVSALLEREAGEGGAEADEADDDGGGGGGGGGRLAPGAGAWGRVAMDGRGLWVATLPAQRAGLARHRLTLRTPAGAALVLQDVQFGEVLACLGQSNIARQGIGSVGVALAHTPEVLAATAAARAAAAAEALPVRYLGLGPSPGYPDLWHSGGEGLQDLPRRAPSLPWMEARALSAAVEANCSSTCWFMGRAVARRAGGATPVGLIDGAVGGSAIQAWSSAAALAACGAPPGAPEDFVSWGPGGQGALYNAVLSPLLVGPLALGGLAWYNGETNSLYQQAAYYACALPALLEGVRGALRKPELRVALVELHPFFIYDVCSAATAEVRGAQQAAAAALQRVTLVPAVDLGDAANNLHPLGMAKVTLGERLGLAFHRGRAEGEGRQLLGPGYARALRLQRSGSGDCQLGVRVEFVEGSIGGGGLELRGWARDSVATRCPEEEGVAALFCDWFSVQSSDGAWHNASAAVSADGQALELSVEGGCSSSLAPVATRNGWSGWPVVQLYDREGLPAHPWAPTPLVEA